MKKLVTLLGFSFFVFTSCSGGGDDTAAPQPQLSTEGNIPKKKTTSQLGVVMENVDYSYNGNRITRMQTASNSYIDFFYTGNLITSSKGYFNSSLNYTTTYSYTNEKLTQVLSLSNVANQGVKTVYTYNPDATVSVVNYEGNLISQNTITGSFKIFFQNGRVSKKEKYVSISGNAETITHQYTYDNKNQYYKEVIGFDKLTIFDNESYFGSANNVSSITVTATNTPTIEVYSSQYTYNSFDYPVTKTDTYPNGAVWITQFYY